ncbi:Hypothetical protein CINCED_3A018305 [Cinara cedri]|uniref:Uncharacterized protein n=1 Tax=Cinara cedri TaxID=506608 RepID=A0A5E4NFK3_9HEMI|nr:Hypothetical protein CINCED_3A018305 [Cinara cedri]
MRCKSKFNCYVCKSRHNTLLHYERQDESSVSKDKSGEDAAETAEKRSSKTSLLVHHGHGHVFLSTALVWVKDKRGNLARQLQLPTVKASMPVSGIGANTVRTSTTVDVHVESRVGQFVFDATCVILPAIMSQLPPVRTPDVGWTIPNELLPRLADPRFHESKQIDLLIGGGAFFDILQPERVQLVVRTLYLQDSKLSHG